MILNIKENMAKISKNIFSIFIFLIIGGCAVFDGENKVVRVAPSFITVQISHKNITESWAWAKSLAKQHCAQVSKVPFDMQYTDNSLHKEETYFCVNEEDQAKLWIQLTTIGYEPFFANMRRTYGGVPSQIQRLGAVVAPLSNVIVPPQTLAPNTIKPIQMVCLKTDESVSGMFKTCRYSCSGTPVTNTVRLNEICEMQKRF